jgi:hypothetical protein
LTWSSTPLADVSSILETPNEVCRDGVFTLLSRQRVRSAEGSQAKPGLYDTQMPSATAGRSAGFLSETHPREGNMRDELWVAVFLINPSGHPPSLPWLQNVFCHYSMCQYVCLSMHPHIYLHSASVPKAIRGDNKALNSKIEEN